MSDKFTDGEREELKRVCDNIKTLLSWDINEYGIPSKENRLRAIEDMIQYLELHEYNIQISSPVGTDKTDEEIWIELIKDGDPLKLIEYLHYNFIKLSSDQAYTKHEHIDPLCERVSELEKLLKELKAGRADIAIINYYNPKKEEKSDYD